MKPKIWGKHFWYTIHLAALGYPDNAQFEEKMAYKDFYEAIGKVLPCKKCTVNYSRHFKDMNIDGHLHSKQQLFNWTVYFHNTVNKELGKPQWNTEYAWSFYNNMCEKIAKGEVSSNNAGAGVPLKLLLLINAIVILIVIIILTMFYKRK